MRAYSTMSEMEYYLRTGKDNFIKMLGGKNIAYTKFIEDLDKANKKLSEFPHDKLDTRKGKKIVDNFCTYRSIEILILSTSFNNPPKPINKDSIEFMFNNYDRERALGYFDPKGYVEYMKQKEKKEKKEEALKVANVEVKESQKGEEKKYSSDNYIDLE